MFGHRARQVAETGPGWVDLTMMNGAVRRNIAPE